MPAHANNPTLYDVSIDIHSHMNRLKPVPGYVVTYHVKNRATRVGAIGHAVGGLKGLERQHVSYVQIQECPGEGSCWFERANHNA